MSSNLKQSLVGSCELVVCRTPGSVPAAGEVETPRSPSADIATPCLIRRSTDFDQFKHVDSLLLLPIPITARLAKVSNEAVVFFGFGTLTKDSNEGLWWPCGTRGDQR
ncbi:hypothetical protein WAI453_000438 [Rhynchosporium graminicola]